MKKKKQIEAAVIPPGEFKLIKRSLIRTRPQIRRTFNEALLAELADSIRVNGIVQPLAVRPVKATHKVLEPDLTCDGWRLVEIATGDLVAEERTEIMVRTHPLAACLEDYFELIMGERRFRAAALAGLDELPCMVREATETERFNWQFIENHQRENVSLLEEAEAIREQLDERQEGTPDFSAEDLAAELGMSRAAIYERLKLTRLAAVVKEALQQGLISTSVAGVVATLPTPKVQETLLKKITDQGSYQFPFSVRDVQRLIENYMAQLDDAPFSKTRADYPAQFEGGTIIACMGCHHRSGNMVDEFPELKARPNVCTDVACFKQKCTAHYTEEAAALAKSGHKVVTMKALNDDPAEYIEDTRQVYAVKRSGTPSELMGKHAPKPVYATDDEGVHTFWLAEEFREACKKNKVELTPESKPVEPPKSETKEERLAREKKEDALRVAAVKLKERKEAFVLTLLPDLKKGIAKLKDGPAWELAMEILEVEGWSKYDMADEFEAVLLKGVKPGKEKLLGGCFCISYLAPVFSADKWDVKVVKYWKRAGVDLVAEWDKAEKEAQPALVIPKSGPKQKMLLDVSATPVKQKAGKMKPEGLARLRAAAKAGWAKVKK